MKKLHLTVILDNHKTIDINDLIDSLKTKFKNEYSNKVQSILEKEHDKQLVSNQKINLKKYLKDEKDFIIHNIFSTEHVEIKDNKIYIDDELYKY